MITITEMRCESCGKAFEKPGRAKTLEENFAHEKMNELCICEDCFNKRFNIETKKSSGYGGTIYELEEKGQPRFGLGSKSFSCLKCSWVAWTEEGLFVHMKRKHE